MNSRDILVAPPSAAISDASLGPVERLARWLIQRAARHAPPFLSERLEEEWLADLATRQGRMSRLRFGVGCCWATRVITREHCAPKVLTASSATGKENNMIACAQHDSSFFSRRTAVFLLIVCLHTLLIYGFVAGFATRIIEVIPRSIQILPLPDQPTRSEPPPPLPQPKLSPSRVEVPAPEIPFDVLPDPNPIREVTPPLEERLLPPPTPPSLVNRVLGGPGRGFPNTEDYYPSVARRIGEKGTATVRVCVNDKGRLTADPTLAQSSGSAHIDEGALRLAKAGSGHYRATTEDGRPVNSCYLFRITFAFRD